MGRGWLNKLHRQSSRILMYGLVENERLYLSLRAVFLETIVSMKSQAWFTCLSVRVFVCRSSLTEAMHSPLCFAGFLSRVFLVSESQLPA